MSLKSDINKFFKKKENQNLVNILTLLFMYFFIVSIMDMGRSGLISLFASSWILGLIFIIVGIVGFIIPEPMSSVMGIAIISIGVVTIMGGSILSSLADSLGSLGMPIIIGVGIIIGFMMFKGRKSQPVIMSPPYYNQRRRY